MGFGDLQFYDIIIFAGIAAFLIYRLRNVLGKRTGFEKITRKESKEIKQNKEKIVLQNVPDLNDNIIKFI